MKNVTALFILFLNMNFVACSTDETIDRALFEEELQDPLADVPTGELVNEDEEKEEIEEPEIVATETCLFQDIEFVSGGPTKINCLLDLEGESVTIPANTILEFDGGDIFNGTLNFSGGTIDGRLLNSKLTVSGNVELLSNEFQFFTSRWNIVEGQTTSDIALSNNKKLEDLMYMVKEMKGDTFKINNLDAYFEVTKVTSTTTNVNFYASLEGINIPSDFHLSMTDNTFLRMYPAESDITNGTIVAVRDVDNVKISGGNLIGDRDLRSYSSIAGEQGTHLMHVHSGRNITIENVNFENGSSGGITVYSIGFSFNPDYKPSSGIKILNNTFINNRRMAIAFTDGRNVEITGNYFENTGQESSNSDGGNVGYSVNIEPVRERLSTGEVLEYQKAFDILVNNNTEVNSRVGFITVIGEDIRIDNNNVETRIAHAFASNVKITNNNLTASRTTEQQFAIFSAGDQSAFVFDNEISNNIISGYGVGISLQTQGVDIFENKIVNCTTGIQIAKTIGAQIFNNEISVSNLGILSNLTYADEIFVENNTISAQGFHIKLSQLNQEIDDLDNSFTINDNNFTNIEKISLFVANGVNVNNNIINGGIEVIDSSNIEINSNKIKPNETDGLKLTGDHSNVSLVGNIITEPTGADRFVCLNNSSNNPNEITETNNQCN